MEVTGMAEYIEREALLAAYDKAHRGPAGRARKLIKEAPAADVVPVVHGRWIHKGQRIHLGVNWWACSVCGDESGAQWMRYCPNCGARMDGADE